MKIISFYSYKGGVGRSLLVANLAAYLCYYKERRVLLVDWDLEAPGLHFYFNRANLKNKGVIELLNVFVEKMSASTERTVNKEELPTFDSGYIVEGIASQGKGRIDLITAGLYDNEYTPKINNFNWEDFYKSYDGLTYIEFLKERFKEMSEYDYIFIDSRTGVSDYWGIINIQIPDVNIFVVAPSNQNFEGVYDIANRIQFSQYVQKRKRQPILLPILSRLDPLNNQKQGEWFALFRDKFRPILVNFLRRIYKSEDIQEKHVDKLIDSTLLNYKTDLSYGEQILFSPENKRIEYSTLEKKYEDIASIIESLFGRNGNVPGIFNEDTLTIDKQQDDNNNISIQGAASQNVINVTEAKVVNVQTILGKSFEYQEMLNRKKELETLLSFTPVEHLNQRLEISRKIEEQKNLLARFEEDVKQLAESFSAIKINKDRLIRVKSLIEVGKISEAREVLETDASELYEEQERLLDERKRLINRSKDVEDQLKSNAEQFLILAQAVASNPTINRYYESARKYFESSIKSAPLPENLMGYALFLHHNNQLSESEKYFNTYLSSFGKKGESRAKGLVNLAILHINTGNFTDAERELREALKAYRDLARKNPEKYMIEVAQTISSLGLLQTQMSNFSEAEKNLDESLRIYQSLAEKTPQIYASYVAAMFNNLGTLHYNLNKFNQAEEEYAKALEIRRALASENPSVYQWNVVTTLNNMGAIYYERREFYEAEKVYNEALAIQKNLVNQNPYVHLSQMFGILNNLGNLYSNMNHFDKSLGCFNEALETYRQLTESGKQLIDPATAGTDSTEYSPHIALTLSNLGILYLNNNKLAEAENHLTQAYQIYRNLKKDNQQVYDNDIARVLNNLGSLYSENDSIERAENSYTEALKIYRRLAKVSPQPYLLELSKILINLSIFYLKDSPNREKSLSMVLEAEGILQSLKDDSSYKYNLVEAIQQIKDAWDIGSN